MIQVHKNKNLKSMLYNDKHLDAIAKNKLKFVDAMKAVFAGFKSVTGQDLFDKALRAYIEIQDIDLDKLAIETAVLQPDRAKFTQSVMPIIYSKIPTEARKLAKAQRKYIEVLFTRESPGSFGNPVIIVHIYMCDGGELQGNIGKMSTMLTKSYYMYRPDFADLYEDLKAVQLTRELVAAVQEYKDRAAKAKTRQKLEANPVVVPQEPTNN